MKEVLEKAHMLGNEKVMAEAQVIEQKQLYIKLPRIHNGHTVYEWNIAKMELDVATLTGMQVQFFGKGKKGNIRKRDRFIVQKPGCVYYMALNEENALKKIAHDFKLQGLTEVK